jgi:tyrosyl-tRNA synthetase
VATDLLGELRWRGLIQDVTEGLSEALAAGPLAVYCGFDPTASSLHVGHLMGLMTLARLQRLGHRPIAVIGGGTAMIGDPSGKSQERTLLAWEEIAANVVGIRPQVAQFLDFDAAGNTARILNNSEWLGAIDLLTFLRDVGKHFTVNMMLHKESVSRRLEAEEGISYTEFSYLLLQAYDFLHLFDRQGCTMQVGGSDQWGNITAGLDLIRRLRGRRAHGLVWPLLCTASGVKFGKTEAGTVWLDPARTSPYEFYQFWLNTDDRDVVTYLKHFTFLEASAIEALDVETRRAPEGREAQRTLARDVTGRVHGAEAVAQAERAAGAMFGGDVRGLSAEAFLTVFGSMPSTPVSGDRVDAGLPLTDLLVETGLAKSKSEGTRLIRSGGVYVNGERIGDERLRLGREGALHGRFFVLRKGGKLQHLVKIEGTAG